MWKEVKYLWSTSWLPLGVEVMREAPLAMSCCSPESQRSLRGGGRRDEETICWFSACAIPSTSARRKPPGHGRFKSSPAARRSSLRTAGTPEPCFQPHDVKVGWSVILTNHERRSRMHDVAIIGVAWRRFVGEAALQVSSSCREAVEMNRGGLTVA
jgi:hypothetical protein